MVDGYIRYVGCYAVCFSAMVDILVCSAPSLCWLCCLSMLTNLAENAAYDGLLCMLAGYEGYDM
jgi:hypothetical protein